MDPYTTFQNALFHLNAGLKNSLHLLSSASCLNERSENHKCHNWVKNKARKEVAFTTLQIHITQKICDLPTEKKIVTFSGAQKCFSLKSDVTQSVREYSEISMHYQSRLEPVPRKVGVWNFLGRLCFSNLCIIGHFPLNVVYFLQDLLHIQWYIIFFRLISQVRVNMKEFRLYFQMSLFLQCWYLHFAHNRKKSETTPKKSKYGI